MGTSLRGELQGQQQFGRRGAVPDFAAVARHWRQLMATLKESAFAAALVAAEAARQVAYAAAFATYAPNGFGVFANLATYQAALVTADNAYVDAVQSAATTNAISPSAKGTIYPGVWPNQIASIVT
jgi:hypothetical protein